MVEEQTVEVRERPRLFRRLSWYRRRVESLEQQTVVDELTGLRNQRALWRELSRRVPACSPSQPIAVVMLDFDLLKDVNESYGYSVGDAVLRRVAAIMRSTAPSPRLAFRYGGDEFVFLTETDEDDARALADQLRAEIACQNGTLPAVTVSCGVVAIDAPVEPWVVLDCVDAALLEAKRGGRNRVVVANGSEPQASPYVAEDLERETARRAALALAVATLQVNDTETANHSEDVVTLCDAVGRRLDFDARALAHLRAGAQLHDVGKVAVPSTILNKPGALTEEEWAVVREHTVIGERILRSVPEMAEVATLVRHSHEHWDGSGYPDGLTGEEIPLASRVILCADAFHAMRLDRPYRRGRPASAASAELRACAGTQFDPAVVDAFLEVAEEARTDQAGGATAGRKRLVILLTTLVIGGGSAVAGIPEVRDAVRSVFGTTTGPSFADTVEPRAQDFGFGPLGDLLEMKPAINEPAPKATPASKQGGERRAARHPDREASFNGPSTGSQPGGGRLYGPPPASPDTPPSPTESAPTEDTHGNGSGRALGTDVPTPRTPALPPNLTNGRTDPPALGLWAGPRGTAKGHSK